MLSNIIAIFKNSVTVLKNWFSDRYKVEKILMTKENRMWRVGGGYNKGISYFRVDFGYTGFRFTRK